MRREGGEIWPGSQSWEETREALKDPLELRRNHDVPSGSRSEGWDEPHEPEYWRKKPRSGGGRSEELFSRRATLQMARDRSREKFDSGLRGCIYVYRYRPRLAER